MQLTVFFTPSSIVTRETQSGDIFLVIDAIRATTTMAVIFERGAARLLAAESIEQARDGAQKHPGCLLCGERNVQRVPGFDYGNSPVQFSQLDLQGRELILTTTNGTHAFHACPPDTTRLAASFYNAEAVTAHALKLAWERNSNIAIVCSGEFGLFALDDTVCAGYLTVELQRQQAEAMIAGYRGPSLRLHESALAAMAVYASYKPPGLIDFCRSAQSVIQAGLTEDVSFCMQQSHSASIPIVVGREEETGLLVLERAP